MKIQNLLSWLDKNLNGGETIVGVSVERLQSCHNASLKHLTSPISPCDYAYARGVDATLMFLAGNGEHPFSKMDTGRKNRTNALSRESREFSNRKKG
jgi:hypothetical protein